MRKYWNRAEKIGVFAQFYDKSQKRLKIFLQENQPFHDFKTYKKAFISLNVYFTKEVWKRIVVVFEKFFLLRF